MTGGDQVYFLGMTSREESPGVLKFESGVLHKKVGCLHKAQGSKVKAQSKISHWVIESRTSKQDSHY